MDFITAVVILVLILFLFHFLAPNPYQDIPGPPIREYLPGGRAINVWTDPRALKTVFVDFSRRYGETYQVWLGFTRTIILSNPSDLAHSTSNSDDFSRSPSLIEAMNAVMPRSILAMDRSEHLKARRQLRSNFNHSLLPSFHQPMLDAVREMCSMLRASPPGQRVDINKALYTVTLRVLLNVALGASMELRERAQFGQAIDALLQEMVRELTFYPTRALFSRFGTRRALDRSRARVNDLACRVVKQRLGESDEERAERPPDLLDAIMGLDDHDTARMVAEVSSFVIAGTHSISVTLSWALFYLCSNPRVYSKLESHLDDIGHRGGEEERFSAGQLKGASFVHSVWKETLRLSGTIPGTMRITRREVTLRGSGVVLPKGTQVLCFFPATQRSAAYFDQPDDFVPERWGADGLPGEAEGAPAGAYIPFGVGARACAGRFFAEYQGPLVLAELMRQFRFRLACPGEEIRSVTGFTETPQWSSKGDGCYDMGVPMYVTPR